MLQHHFFQEPKLQTEKKTWPLHQTHEPRGTHLLPDLPEADWPGEERLAHDLELVGLPQPPPPGVGDLDGHRLDVLFLPRPPREAATSVVSETQPHLQ